MMYWEAYGLEQFISKCEKCHIPYDIDSNYIKFKTQHSSWIIEFSGSSHTNVNLWHQNVLTFVSDVHVNGKRKGSWDHHLQCVVPATSTVLFNLLNKCIRHDKAGACPSIIKRKKSAYETRMEKLFKQIEMSST